MADQNDNEFEEEFDFESDDSLLEGTEEAFDQGESGYSVERKKPPLPMILGGGLAGLVLVGVAGMMFFGGKKETPPPPMPVAEAPAKPKPKPVEEDPWAVSVDSVFGSSDKPKVTPQSVMDKLEAQEKELKLNIQSLERKLDDLLSKINMLDQSVGSSGRGYADLSQQLEMMNRELKSKPAQVARPAKKKVKPVTTEAFVNPTMVVHAIIPGRAWLRTRDGRTITVTEGDAIEGYGKVLAIDAPAGVVITSSGVMLR